MDYHLKPIGKTCAATGRPFKPGERCHSVLVERDGQFVRLDFSEEGWKGPPPDALAYWTCRYPESREEKPRRLDTESLMQLFEQLMEDPNPAQEKLCYVLALLLLQRKRLSLEGSREVDGVEYLEFNGKMGEGPFLVRDQQLSDEEIQQIQHELVSHLWQQLAA